MTFRNTEYLVLVDDLGEFASGQVKRVQVAQDGTIFPAAPIDMQQADLVGLFDQFNGDLLRANVALKAQLAKEQSEHAAAIESLTATHAEALSTLNQSVQALTGQLEAAQATLAAGEAAIAERSELQSQVATLTNRITQLLGQLPFNTRRITVPAFLNRLTQASLLMLFSDDDPGVQQIAAILKEWAKNSWPIDMDSIEFTQAMGYLTVAGKLSAERVAAITVDSTRDEAPQ